MKAFIVFAILFCLCWAPSFLTQGNLYYMPVEGGKRYLVRQNWIVVAPGIVAEVNVDTGQTAYDKCMNETPSTFACESARTKAITDDAGNRFKIFLVAVQVGRDFNQTLTDLRMWIMPLELVK